MLTLASLWLLVSVVVFTVSILALLLNRRIGVVGILALTLISAACLSIPLMV